MRVFEHLRIGQHGAKFLADYVERKLALVKFCGTFIRHLKVTNRNVVGFVDRAIARHGGYRDADQLRVHLLG